MPSLEEARKARKGPKTMSAETVEQTEATEQTATIVHPEGSGEVEQENAPAAQNQPAPAATGGKRKSTAVNLIGTRYEEYVTDGRFRPGYDAKAKSQMVNDAISDNPELVAEAEAALAKMNWTHFLTTKREAIAAGVNKPKAAPGERKLTGAALKAQQNKMKREAGEGVEDQSGTPAGGATSSGNVGTMPDANTIWIRTAKRGIFVMRGEDPIKKFASEEAANANAFAETHFAEQGGEGAGLTLDLSDRN